MRKSRSMPTAVGLALLVLLGAWLLSAPGCGETPSEPKTELNDSEKQQIIELNEQRTKEWSGK